MSSGERLAIVVLGTLVVHVGIAAGLSSVDPPPRRKTPQLEIVDIEPLPPDPPPPPPPKLVEPEPPPPPPPAAEPPPPAPPPPQPTKVKIARSEPRTQPPPPASEPPPATSADDVTSGGAPTLKMDNLGVGTTGVAVDQGTRSKGKTGRGGKGGGDGTGTGTGSGSAAPPPQPVSVASIKNPAKAKPGFDYFDARKDYPEEAQRLGIEGRVKVRLTVDAKGKVTAAKLLNKLGHGLDELAMKRAKVIEFIPAIDTDDRAVASVVVWTFTFALPK